MKRDFTGYLLALISILIGGYFSWYFYDKSLQFRRPIFAADLFPQTIYDAKKELRLPLKVTREDGTPLEKSVHSANHKFWNAGNLPIATQDVLTPIRVKVLDEDAELLAVAIAGSTRNVVDCKVTREGRDSFVLTFRILEQDDGCLLNFIYSGPQAIKYAVEGDIVGVKKIEARLETMWDLIRQSEQSESIATRALPWAALAIPWIPTFIFVYLLMRQTRSRRTQRLLSSVVLFSAITWLTVTHFNEQRYVMTSKIPSPALNWQPIEQN